MFFVTLSVIGAGLVAPSWLSTSLKEPGIILLRGLTFSLAGLILYEAGNGFFKHVFDHEFKSKERAQMVLVMAMLAFGMLSDPFTQFYSAIYEKNHIFLIFGFLMLGTRILTNEVNDWNHIDDKPVTWAIYSSSLFLMGLGYKTAGLVLPSI